MIEYTEIGNTKIAVISCCALGDLIDVSDMMGTVYFEGRNRMIAPKEVFRENNQVFFKATQEEAMAALA